MIKGAIVRHCGKLALAAGLALTMSAQAGAQFVTWTGPNDFDNAQISFAAFAAGSLTSVTGVGYVHNHSNPAGTNYTLDIHYVAGSWATIYANNVLSVGGTPLSTIGPVTFVSGMIDGLRLTSNPANRQSYHRMANEQFNFGPAVVATPEPASLTLLASGLVGLAFAGRRRRKVSSDA